MRLTLAWLSVCLAIYCSGGHGHGHSHSHGNVVLSLPPSLIATATEAAALRLQQQQQQPRWKKDARVLFDSGNDALRDMLQSQAAGKFSLQHHDNQQPQAADFNRKPLRAADDLGAQSGLRQQSVAQEIAPLQRAIPGLNYGATPHKYWASRCQGRMGPSAKCPQEYYRAMMAARNKEAMARLHMQLGARQDSDSSSSDINNDELLEPTTEYEESNGNEVFMLLTGEQDLIKFLHWAMQLLYPFERPEGNRSESAAENYHPGMFLWKKLNLSGNLEPPLIVDEPQFVLVRREKLLNGYNLGDEISQEDDPFIPPRGRKHSSPDLNALFSRHETFVPNRGRRDKVKDLFKYDELFFPNRGKRHRSIFKLDDPFYPNRGKKLQLRDLYKIDDPFFPNRGKRHLTGSGKTPPPPPPPPPAVGLLGKTRKLPDDSDNWPQRMSTHKINGYDQSVKPSMSVEDATLVRARVRASTAAEGARWRRLAMGLLQPANRLHSTRSMSANLQQPQQEQELGLGLEMGLEQLVPHLQQQQQQQRSSVRFIGNPIMPRQQVKPSWPGSQRLKRSLQPDDAPETQLTRSPNTNPQKIDSESDSDSDSESVSVSDSDWDWDWNRDTDDANWSI
ncbi:uncharacterized protein LOC111066525 [Drosophila obscura]|uniref:uncharacterized protein LOC111066525 n=1 Tax=Drosophila obscura TaxID=7282 RepID=UPI001BB29142|nr:uncharacterized protein LOC111066525 [Drosophila obscura]